MLRRARVGVGLIAFWLCVAGSALAAGVPVQQASKDQLKAAQRTFEAADTLFDAKRYDEAITAYRASYEIVASPNSRLMIARSLEALGRLEEAYQELQGAVQDAQAAAAADSKYGETLKAVQAELAALEPKVGRVKITLSGDFEGAKVTIGKRSLSAEQLSEPIVVAPGAVSVTATMPDGRSAKRDVNVAAGATESVELTLSAPAAPVAPEPAAAPPVEPAAPEQRSSDRSALRPWAYVAGGVGAAGLLTFTVFGLMDKSKFNDLDSSCTGGHCPPDRQSDIDAGKRDQTIANIGLVVGVLGVGAGATLFVLSNGSHGSERAARLRVQVAPSYAAVSGQF